MKPNVLLLYRSLIPSICLCGHYQLKKLAQNGVLDYTAVNTFKVSSRQLQKADIVVIGRLDNPYELKIIRMLKKSNKPIFYILDDDLPDIPMNLSSSIHYHTPIIRESLLSMIELSDGLISPSYLLIEKYAKDKKHNILVEEPAAYFADYVPNPDGPVKIGFAGSLDRTGDLEDILKNVLLRIKQEYSQKVQFQFMGAIPSFAHEVDAQCYSYQKDYEDYLHLFAGLHWDIGIAPMPDSTFHQYKHYIKFIEYSSMGIAGIFSDVEPYTRLSELAEKKLLLYAVSEQEWYTQLKYLIDHPGVRDQMRLDAISYAKNNYSLDILSEAFGKKLMNIELPAHSKHSSFFICLKFIKIKYLIHLVAHKFYTKCKTILHK